MLIMNIVKLNKNYLFVGLALLFLLADTVFADELKVNAYVERNIIGLNQQFVLKVELSGENANSIKEINLPDTDEFAELLSSGGTSQSIQFINGRMSVQKIFSYYFRAKKTGTFRFPSITVLNKGKKSKSAPFNIQVVKSTTGSQQKRNRGKRTSVDDTIENNLFLKARVNKRRVYQNEPIIVTYRLYYAVNVTQIGTSKSPNTTGFWAEEFDIPNPPPSSTEVVNGRRYNVAEIKKTALFPTGTGKVTIGALGLDCDVRVQSRRSKDFFDSFFDDPFFGRTVRKTVFSQPIEIEVLPLPKENRTADFTGAVGHYRITASIDKDSVATNEAITFTLNIAGTGNIRIVGKPKVSFTKDFQQFEPKVSETITRKNNRISGTKKYEYVLIPRFPGLQTIKPIHFSYFDPGKKQYIRLQTKRFNIKVGKGEEQYAMMTPGTSMSKEEVVLLGKDIRFIKKEPDDFIKEGWFFYKSSFFMMILLVPMAAVAGAFVYRRHLDKLSGNIAYARRRRARSAAMRYLKKSRHYLNESTQKEFYGNVSQALLEFLADKLNISSAGIITTEVEGLLRAEKVDDEKISAYLDCLNVCDYQRFAPSKANVAEMKEFYKKASNAIVELEKVL